MTALPWHRSAVEGTTDWHRHRARKNSFADEIADRR